MTVELPDSSPTTKKNPHLVQDMFDRVAPRYDLMNTLLSGGFDHHWRQCAVRRIDAHPGMRILDVATGTAPLAALLEEAGATVVGLDFSWNMLAAGAAQRARRAQAPLHLVNGDGNHLPFADNTFDGITIGFGLRNFPDPQRALREFIRVVKPGGTLAVLEFSRPLNPLFNLVYHDYLVAALPKIAKVVSSDPSAYVYLANSILQWPDQEGLAQWIAKAGWTIPRWQNLTGGIVALHLGTKACH